MLSHQWLRCAVTVCLLVASQVGSSPGLQAGYPVVGRSTGTVAVQVRPDADWRVVSVGGILPDVADARTSAPGPGHLQADQGFLALGPLSRIKYDLTARRVDLATGSLFCKPEGDQPWTIQVATSRVVIAPHSEIEVAVGDQSRLTVTALSGSADVRGPNVGSDAARVGAKEILIVPAAQAKLERKSLDTAAEVALKSWTRQAGPGQGVGQLVIKDSQGNSPTRLNIARYHAEVVLQPPVALVKLDQSFYNPYNRQEEGEFIFNLPPGASVSRFAMFVTRNQLIEGEVIERMQADQVYTSIVRSQRDPAILEQIGDNLFKMRVFPILPHDEKRILLDFTLPLDGRDGQYQMQLPLMSNLLPIWDFRVFGSIRGPTPLASVQLPTLPDVKLASQGPNEIAFDFSRTNYQPRNDFVVAFKQPIPESATKFRRLIAEPLLGPNAVAGAIHDPFGTLARNSTQPPDPAARLALPKGGLVSTYFQTDLPAPALDGVDSPADVLVLIDTSAGLSRERLGPALQTTLASLREQDRFRLVAVDVVTRPLHAGWLTPHSREAATAYQAFEQQIYLGASDMPATCRSVAAQYADRDVSRRRMVIYIGGGLDSVNLETAQTLAGRCAAEITKAGATLFAVNVLPAPKPYLRQGQPAAKGAVSFTGGGGMFQVPPTTTNTATTNGTTTTVATSTLNNVDGRLLLTALTEAAGGRHFDFADQPTDRGRYFEWLLSGVPTPARVERLIVADCAPSSLFYPSNLLPGEVLRVVGVKPGPVDALDVAWQVKTGGHAAHTAATSISAEVNTQDHLVGRQWADQRLRQLQKILAARPGEQEVHGAIIQLSREWSVLTPQTAFLVLETEADYVRWNVPRQARRRYWNDRDLPPVTPLPNDWLAKLDPDRAASPHTVRGVVHAEDVVRNLEEARKAVQSGHVERARTLLDELKRNEVATSTEEYQSLRKLVDILSRQSRAVQSLGIKQAWFDFGQSVPSLPTGLDRLLVSSSPITSNLLQRHPLAEALMREITLPVGEMSLVEFAHYLKQTLGINVAIDPRKLEEESVDVNTPQKLPPLKNLMAMNAIQLHLDTFNCTVIEEPRRLLITTKTEAISHRPKVLFPARDLLTANPKFDFEDLQDPLYDRDEMVRKRVESKLQKIVSWKLTDASLEEVLNRFRNEIGENLLVDEMKLEEESVSLGLNDISCDYDNVQLGEVLRWILDQKNLTSLLEREALKITTKTEGIGRRPVRVYSGQGLLFQDPHPNRQPWPGSGGGMGGWMGGGFGFGMGGMGGMGGGMMGSMGGMGGISIGAPTADRVVTGVPANSGVSQDGSEPTVTAPDDDEITDAIDSNDRPQMGFSDGQDYVPDNVSSTIQALQQQTGGPPDAPWMEADGEGGAIGFYYPSLAIVLRQTQETHVEIAEHFRQQRLLLAKRGLNPNMVATATRAAILRGEKDVDSLIYLLQQTTGGPPDGPWMDFDGEGGAITYERAPMALSIRQTPQALDEIAGVLVQLRRERYALVHQSRPWEQGLFLDRQPGLFSGPWLTPSNENGPTSSPVTDAELAVLKVRRELPSGHWKWNDDARGMSAGFNLRVAGDKLAIDWPGWQIRVQGAQSSVSLTDLKYAEIGTWGQPLRDWLDVQIVFWPHRSNQELAALFNIEQVAAHQGDGQNQTRLKFVPAQAGANTIALEIVYDQATGLPVVWEAYRRDTLVQRYRFSTELVDGQLVKLLVRQESNRGQLLAQGEWTSAGNVEPIADAETLAAGTIVIDRRPQTRASLNVVETALQEFRLGKFELAAKSFRRVLEQYPEHPLALFLLAWSLDHQPRDVDMEQLRAAYAGVIRVAPPQLSTLLTQHTSQHLSTKDLYAAMLVRPEDKRSLSDEINLAKLALQASQVRAANKHARTAWGRQPASQEQALEVAQLIVESHLRLNEVDAAIDFYKEVAKPDESTNKEYQTAPVLYQMLATFEYFKRGTDVAQFYQEMLGAQDAALTPDMRRSLLKRYADTLRGMPRWKQLLQAIELLPADSPEALSELDGLLIEVTRAQEWESFAELAALTKHHRYQQMLRAKQADWTRDLKAASDMYWSLHQDGFLFENEPARVSERLIAAGRADLAVAILETFIRSGKQMTGTDRYTLAKAYELAERPLDAKRVMSEVR